MYPGRYATTAGRRLAIVESATGRQVTYAQLEERSVRFAHWLTSHGVGRGDHVAALSTNDATVFELYWGAIRIGAYFTMVNTHLAAAEAAFVVDDCDARVVVVSASLVDLATAIMADTPNVRYRLAFGGAVPGHSDYGAEIAACSAQPPTYQPRGSDMLYSSGTTGRPKGIKPRLTGAQVGEEPGGSVVTMLRGFGFDEGSVYMSPAPIYHAAPLRMGAAAHALGGTVVLMDRFDPERCLAAIDEYQVTHSQWVPTHFVRMLKLPAEVRERYSLSTMRAAIHSAAPCPVMVKRDMMAWWGEILHEYYSSTESIGSTIVGPADWLAKPGTVGRTGVPGSSGHARICGPAGDLLPPGEIGTVYFERHDYTFEYHNDPDKTARSRHQQHADWSTTGDVGYLDADDYLFLTGRDSFTIISGGVNIYPQEIENCLTVHPKVFDVAVVGVPDDEMGESVTAFVQPMPGVKPSDELEAELIAYCRAHIAHYKCPRTIGFVTDLPRNPVGKMVKGALRDRAADGNGRTSR